MIRKHDRNGVVLEVPRNYDKDPPSSYIWHREEDLPRFLDGHTITKYGKEIDGRKSNFYRAEALFGRMMRDAVKPLTNVFGELEQVAEFIFDVWSTAWWQRRYEKSSVHIKDGRGTHNAISWPNGSLTLPRMRRNPLTVLHEMIHFTVPKPHSAHGRLFCARFKEIVGWYWGDDAERALAESYRWRNVKWHPHHDPPEGY